MKHTRLIAILMALMMLVGMLGVTAYADETETTPDRIVTIHKTDSTEAKNGLANITFDFFYVCSIDKYVNGDVKLGTGIVTIEGKDYFSSPTADDIANYATDKTPVVTVTTDAKGDAVANFGTDKDGIYLVVERPNPAIETVANPFFIAIPGGAEAGSDLCEIDIQPKNTVKTDDILIEKDVTKIDNEHDTYDVGENHTWIIQSSIPQGIGTGLKYEVSDTLDERLTLVSVDRVAIAADAGSFGNSEDLSYTKDENETPAFGEAEIVLTKDVHYTVTMGDNAFVMALTTDGMAYVAEKVGANYANNEIRTYFTAYINNKAVLGENIPNQAHVDFTNNVGTDYDADSDKPEVHAGGLKLIKTDAASGKLLSGATFTLNVKNEDGTYTPVKFYSDAAMTKQVSEITTDGNGEAIFYGVAYGTYYLIETEAPDGYNLLSEPVQVVINEFSHLPENNVEVVNSAKFQLPETGGIGTLIFTLGGSSLFAAAGALLVDTKKKYR